MPVSAQTILTASFQDLNVLAAGEALSPELGEDGLRRLNNMASSWRTQYGTVPAIQRTIFNLVADKQTYTIGLGGNFNVPRPNTVNGAALWLAGLGSAVSVTGITRSGYTATVAQTSHPYAVGDEAYLVGATQILYNGLQTVQSVPNANSWTFTVQGTPVSPATGTITAAPVDGTPTEIPCPVITDSSYQFNQLKNMSNSQFTTVYYNPTYPFGTVTLWPLPDVATNQLVLYLQTVFTGFADLTTQYDWPDLPGYVEAIQYQLDLRLATPYGKQQHLTQTLMDLARETFGCIKRANNKLLDLPNDAALISGDQRGGYNINTSNY